MWVAVAGIVVVAALAAYYLALVREPPGVVEERPALGRIPEGVRTKSAVLYFAHPDGEHLVREVREIVAGGGVGAEARRVVEALVRGPLGEGGPTFPPETTVESMFLDAEGCLYVNVGRELRAYHWGGTSGEILTVRSLVRTLAANFPEVRCVWLLEEGHPLETLGGHLDLGRALWVDDWR